MQEQETDHRPWLQWLNRVFPRGIRGKIILPYTFLTLIVALVGVYVVTSLVFSSLDERLTNQVLEAGRAVSDAMVRHELEQARSARAVALTVGLAEALRAGDREKAAELALPIASVEAVECFILFDAQGRETLHALRQDDGTLETVEEPLGTPPWIVQALLAQGDPQALPARGLGLHPADQRYYYFTALPVPLNDEMAGVVVVGTSLNALLPRFQSSSLAHVVIHTENGRAIASTFTLGEQPAEAAVLLETLSIPQDTYDWILNSTETSLGENVEIRGRPYRLARGPLYVGSWRLGVFTVALPSNFVIQAGVTNRNMYALIFTAAVAAVVVIGYLIAQRITRPLNRLVRVSQAVAEGNLSQRTGIVSADEIGRLAVTFDEMTRRLAERTRTLEETLSRLRAILSSIGDGVVLEDRQGNFIPLNAAAETLLREMASEFVHSPLRELSPEQPEQPSDLQPSPWLLERRRFQVGKRVINVHSAAVRMADGELLGTVIVLRDVTAEVEAEQLKDAFVAHVSHELRTPLTAIKGYSELLLSSGDATLSQEQRRCLETITHHTDNLVAMINSLLDFSEIEADGRLRLLPRPLQLSDLVETVAEEWRSQMVEKSLTFEVEMPADLPQVNADARRLRWAIVNLVRNAWQYTPAGGTVTMRLSAHDDKVVLDVSDTGVGISLEEQQRLFRRFYRVSEASYGAVRGIGLGLYVTKAIVEAHGGEVRVASQKGVGSTFSVILPALRLERAKQV